MSNEREHPSRPVDTPTPRDLSPDPSPPESRASPSFSFHEERRLLKSDEYWLSTRLVGGRPSSVSTSPQAGKDALANFHHSLELDQAIEEAYTDVLQARGAGFVEPSTMESPSGPEGGDLDPLLASVHRQEGDRDERLSLAEEKRERQISNMNDIVHPMAALRADEKKEEGKTQTVDTVRAFAESGIGSELEALYDNFSKCLALRDKYMMLSNQRLGDNPRDYDGTFQGFAQEGAGDVGGLKPSASVHQCEAAADGQPWKMNPPPPPPHWKWSHAQGKPVDPMASEGQNGGEDVEALEFVFDPKDVPGPEPEGKRRSFGFNDEGVYQVFDANDVAKDGENAKPIWAAPRLKEYYSDLDYLLGVCSDGPAKSFAFRRLKYLASKWTLYTLLNEYQELADMKAVPHRDFYNVRKVDTHIHHSASMNQKHLLRFIKSKLRKAPDEIVIHRDGKDLTLKEVFESLNLTAYDLSIDTLDMHAHQEFHRFDRFNNRYNPTGSSRLREIFLKTDNLLKGKYLAELTKELISDLEQSKYQNSEWRLSIYGRNVNEWDKLAKWVVNNKLVSHNVRWLIQIPRLYDVYKGSGLVNNFEDIVRNVFQPLFEVTADPSSHPELHVFLQRVVGFDSVDDESKPERRLYRKFPTAKMWDTNQSPPYSYWIYYMYANLTSLNSWRKERGFNTLVLRPHCGEAGDPDHLSSAFLTAHSISHGILLRKVPALQYLFYLKQIGLAMSPLSNNALFLTYERNPFKDFFKVGMNVSLSTDDPLQFHFTAQHLLEEYSCAAQIYKLTPADMCELARNSVVQSGWEMQVKKHWIGNKWYLPGSAGNDIHKTNVPNIRMAYRHATLLEELTLIQHGTHTPSATPMPMKSAGVSPSDVAAAAMSQTKRYNQPTLVGGASVLETRRRKSISNLQRSPALSKSTSMAFTEEEEAGANGAAA
ncbi:AMP deaminase [Vanrija pseudolonga]|uniref:AMP deaminase n=1 Tax=Vanrija pseudolonga TaxID=143232 RepID=A0AAF0Y5Z0_9TREE|nr:AMP deaminase [Vanrija pseudolonga]